MFFNNAIYITLFNQAFLKLLNQVIISLKLMQRLPISVYFIAIVTGKMEKYWKCEFRVMICTLLVMFRYNFSGNIYQRVRKIFFSPILKKNFKIISKIDKNSLLWKTWKRCELLFLQKKWVISITFAYSMTARLVTVLTHFSPMFHFYTPRKTTFLVGIKKQN